MIMNSLFSFNFYLNSLTATFPCIEQFFYMSLLLLHRLWRLRSRRRTGCVCPSRTRLQSQVIGGPAPPGLTGRLLRSPRAPPPQQPVLQTSLQPTTPAPRPHHQPPTMTRTQRQTRHQSMENLRAAMLQSMEGQSRSHHQEVGVNWGLQLSLYI